MSNANASYQSPLQGRYASPAMLKLFSNDTRYSTWRKLWVALAETEMELGLPITQEQVDELRAHIYDIDYDCVAAKEKEIRLVTAKQDPKNAKKPEQVLAKIVEGQIGKMYKEICLLQMPFVKDDKLSVAQYVESVAKELGKAVKVTGFVRFEKGEGIEKRQDDLAAEVSKLVNG